MAQDKLFIYISLDDSTKYLFERLYISDYDTIYRKQWFLKYKNVENQLDSFRASISKFDSFVKNNIRDNIAYRDTLLIRKDSSIYYKDGTPFITFEAPKFVDSYDISNFGKRSNKVFLQSVDSTESGICYNFRYFDKFISDSQYNYKYSKNFWIVEYDYLDGKYVLTDWAVNRKRQKNEEKREIK